MPSAETWTLSPLSRMSGAIVGADPAMHLHAVFMDRDAGAMLLALHGIARAQRRG